MICGPGLIAGFPILTCSPGLVTIPTPFPAFSSIPLVSVSSTVTTMGVPFVQSKSSPASLMQVAVPTVPSADADSTGITISFLCGDNTDTCFGNSPLMARIAAFIAPAAVAPVVWPSLNVLPIISSGVIITPSIIYSLQTANQPEDPASSKRQCMPGDHLCLSLLHELHHR